MKGLRYWQLKTLDAYYDLKWGIGNLRCFFRAVWKFRTWDFAYLLPLLEVGTRRMAHAFAESNFTVDAMKRSRELLIVAELCKRIHADDYWRMKPFNKRKDDYKFQGLIAKRDVEYLARMMQKLRLWWY